MDGGLTSHLIGMANNGHITRTLNHHNFVDEQRLARNRYFQSPQNGIPTIQESDDTVRNTSCTNYIHLRACNVTVPTCTVLKYSTICELVTHFLSLTPPSAVLIINSCNK